MWYRQRRRIAALVVAVLVMAPALGAGELQARATARGNPAGSVAAWESIAQAWRALLAFWLPLGRPAASGRDDSPGRGTGLGLTAKGDNGCSLDPNGLCVRGSSRSPTVGLTCDEGGSLDPSGRCVRGSSFWPRPVPLGDEGCSLDPSGCIAH